MSGLRPDALDTRRLASRSPLLAGKALPTITAGDVERFKQQLLKLPKKGRGSLIEMSNGKWI